MGGCHVKLMKEQRLEIGRRIYNNEITKFEAAEKYGISVTTARDYMRMYRDANHLPPKKTSQHAQGSEREATLPAATEPAGLEEIQSMTKDELINALIWERIDNTILKKKYAKKVNAKKKSI